MDDLKPCPFCGRELLDVLSYDPYDGYQGDCSSVIVKCVNCRATVQGKTIAEATATWNRRAGDGQ